MGACASTNAEKLSCLQHDYKDKPIVQTHEEVKKNKEDFHKQYHNLLNRISNYEKGGYGYGHAKQELFELILERFAVPREKYHYYMDNLEEVDKALAVGAEKAKVVANNVLKRVRSKVGY